MEAVIETVPDPQRSTFEADGVEGLYFTGVKTPLATLHFPLLYALRYTVREDVRISTYHAGLRKL